MSSFLSILRAVSEPTRLRLLLILREEELTVAEVQDILGMGQSRISAHLGQLRRLGLLQDRRVGKNIFYSAGATVREELGQVLDACAKELEHADRDRTALRLAIRKRKDRAAEYFDKLAGKFGRTYIPGRSWQALAHAVLRLLPPMDIADLGAGEGTLSQLLARNAKRVIAIDSAAKMVEFGTKLAKEHGFSNLEFRLGDIEAPPIADESVDLALFSQALHHASNPHKAVREALRILRPGGRAMVLDLASHSQDEVRDLYAHVWLGFSEVDLHEMLREAGFEAIDVRVVSKEKPAPHFQTILALGTKPAGVCPTVQ